ncbi:chondroitin sulfate proteoglycan 4-like [Physella acuta]|uniref:chondroitin sulfate proteoglycan 4-like n=1 Tax=Physella acuta TaxID=109671 RepID=UPI0027DD7FA6|nr:chondroitin sulfate proteoglycan 4-like [Physella acuta]
MVVDGNLLSLCQSGGVFFILTCFIGQLLNIENVHGNPITDEVSLYGESYIQNSLKDASSQTRIQLEFQTGLPHGLLLLAAGQTDYVIVQLIAGTLEVRVNLGSGEAVILSARGVRLDNQRWHSLVINRTEDVVYLELDGVGQGQASTPGSYHDLNIDLGVFLGGTGDLKRDFDHSIKSFRGCMRQVHFNGHNILEEVKSIPQHQVAWKCDDVFSMPSSAPFSMNHESAYLALPFIRIGPEHQPFFACLLKTRSSNALVLFNSGVGATSKDFIAVELVDGKPKLSVDKGGGVIEVALGVAINDGKWHQMELALSENTVEIGIDGRKNVTTFYLGNQNKLNLGGYLYVGGVGVKARPQAVKLGLVMPGSLLGCVKNIRMNSRSYGFEQVQSSWQVDGVCRWEYPCAEDPCISTAVCKELQGSKFECHCPDEECVKPVSQQNQRGIVSVGRVQVEVGGSVVINSSVIQVNKRSLGQMIRDENIFFVVKDPPKDGIIETRRKDSISLRDLTENSVYYKHLGGPPKLDSVTFDMGVSSTSHPEHFTFVLPITIIAKSVNKLEVTLPRGGYLVISLGAKVRITPAVLNVKSPEQDPSNLIFSVIFLRESGSFFHHSNDPRKAIKTFTLKDVQDGFIWFQHSRDNIVYTRFNVTDGAAVSSGVDLRFKVEEMRLSTRNNTGATLYYGSSSLITSQNLSSTANTYLEDLDLRYQVTQPPSHGSLQVFQYGSSDWSEVSSFSQSQIDSGRVRYTHHPGRSMSVQDSFRFEVIYKNVKTQTQIFLIRIKSVKPVIDQSVTLVLHQALYAKVSNKTLLAVVNVEHNPDSIKFTMERSPKKGNFYLSQQNINNPGVFDQFTPLKENSTFTQEDVNAGFLYYKFDKTAYERTDDMTSFLVSYFGFYNRVRLSVQFSPEQIDIRFVNNGLKNVPEGGAVVITKQDLYLEMEKYKKFTFWIVKPPDHGRIGLRESVRSRESVSLSELEQLSNISSFTMSDIKDGKVVYKHDDSENDQDFFTFTTTPILEESQVDSGDEFQEYSGKFQISIKMKNDNPPFRTFNKVFQVAIGHAKVLTINDLSFTDPDIDFDDSQLKYTRQVISNGDILHTETEDPVYSFTQSDLISGTLMFQHTGENYARTQITVTDGEFFSSSMFEIQASKPYIKIVNNTGVRVGKGDEVLLNGTNLSMDSNLNYKPDEVSLKLMRLPAHGGLWIRGRQAEQLTYLDVLEGQVKYWHNGDQGEEDKFTILISLGQVETQADIQVKVITEGLSDPPEIVHNQILKVPAQQSETISENVLKVYHKRYPAAEIEYIITQLPQYGHLVVKGIDVKAGNVPEFTQQDINDKLIIYTSDSPDSMSDSFRFDVGTEFQSLRQLEFLIEILPRKPQRVQANVTVMEGGTVTLSNNVLALKGRLAQSSKVIYRIQQSPVHGKIVLRNGRKDAQVNNFTLEDVGRSKIAYVHDGSESLLDQAVIIAETTDASLGPQTYVVSIKVTPVDDQAPRVVLNKGLDLWTGSLKLLTSDNLQASDPDSSSSQILYQTSSPTNGHLAFLNNTFKRISRFTQMDIDNKQVVFVHKGAEFGDFKFDVTDGNNTAERRQIFQIRARPVQISVSVNNSVQVFPGVVQPITNSSLLAQTSSANFSHPIVYTVQEPRPTLGKLLTKVQQRFVEINSFTQDDINDGLIYFQTNHTMVNWSHTDHVGFEISTLYAKPIENKILKLDISLLNINEDNYPSLLNLKFPHLKEGEKVHLNHQYFDATGFIKKVESFRPGVSVELSFASLTKHGYLWFKGRSVEKDEVFTQENLNNGELDYIHDDSDSILDFFNFTVKILVPRSSSEPSHSVAKTFKFHIFIQPVNDRGFVMVTQYPRIAVKQGGQVVVTSDNLTTVDLDTGPDGIEYTIIKQPEHGKFVRDSSSNSPITTFTQKEINDGRIVFKHNGTRKSRSSMRFKVWDGVFGPQTAGMEISVELLNIVVGEGRHVPLVQGSRSVVLSNQFMQVSTNGDYDTLLYRVTQPPHFGQLLKMNAAVMEFSQSDVDSGQLTYLQNKDSPGNDFFTCNITLGSRFQADNLVTFEVIMKPLVKQGPLVTSNGLHVAITIASLDASELAELTNDNPQFEITVPPKYGSIMRRHRQRRQATLENHFQPVKQFTFEDILYTKMYYVASGVNRGVKTDNMTYILRARGVPPAEGQLVIEVTQSGEAEADKSQDDTGSTNEEAQVDNTPDEANTSLSSESETQSGVDTSNSSTTVIAIILPLIFILVIAVVLVILFIRWRRRKRGNAEKEMKYEKPRPLISGPLQLEQSHVMLEPVSKGLASPGSRTSLVEGHSVENDYVNSSHINKSHEVDSSYQLHSAAPSPSAQTTSPTHSQSEPVSEELESSSMLTSGRGSNASNDLMDWTLLDPELLQHFRPTTPVLRTNQYWL